MNDIFFQNAYIKKVYIYKIGLFQGLQNSVLAV